MNTKPSTETLLPCPCCGHSKLIVRVGAPGCHYIKCPQCGLSSHDTQRDRTIELWNTRDNTPEGPWKGIADGLATAGFDIVELAYVNEHADMREALDDYLALKHPLPKAPV